MMKLDTIHFMKIYSEIISLSLSSSIIANLFQAQPDCMTFCLVISDQSY